MKINGLIVDTQKIADGLYQIICDKGEEGIVAFGMIPKWIVDSLETQLREKLIATAAAKLQVSPEELAPYISEDMIRATVDPIVRQVTTDIYGSAKRAGRMIV